MNGIPSTSPEHMHARMQNEAQMEAKIAQHRADNPDAAVSGFAEAAASNKKIEDEAARNRRIEDRRNSDEVAQLDIEASDAIYGTRDQQKTVKNPGGKGTHKRTVKGKPGKIDRIKQDKIYGNGQNERDEKADEYKNQVEELFEEFGGRDGDGSLAKAKLAMDLREEAWSDAEEAEAKVLEKTHHLIELGANPEGSEGQASPRERAIAFVAKKMQGSESNVSDEVRLHIIKDLGENGVFTREDYEKAKKEYVDQGGDLTKLPREPQVSSSEQDSSGQGGDKQADASQKAKTSQEKEKAVDAEVVEDEPEVVDAEVVDESPSQELVVAKPDSKEVEPVEAEAHEVEELRLIANEENNNQPPESSSRRGLRDRFRDFCVKLAHGGGEKGDKARKALRYATLGLVGAAAVIGVNELVDGDKTTTLYEITNQPDLGSSGVDAGSPTMIDTLPDTSTVSTVSPETFNVEAGNGFTHEIMDYANAHGVKDVTPEQAFRIYEHLEGQHGANLINVLGDSDKFDTYLMGDSNYGIDSPGKAVWADGVEDTIRKDLGLSPLDADAQVGLGGSQEVPSNQNMDAQGNRDGISVSTGDGDPLAENIALGATGAAVAMGAAYYADRRAGDEQAGGGNGPQNGESPSPNGASRSQEQPTEVDNRQYDQRITELEQRSLELQNHVLELNQFISFVMSQLPQEERERIAKAWQAAQEQARREQEEAKA